MIPFEEYFSFNNIVDFLVKQRIKISFQAHQRQYLDKILKLNNKIEHEDLRFLQSVLPPRKKWSRSATFDKRQKLNTAVENNTAAIKNSVYKIHRRFVNKELQFLETPLWYQNLRKYIFEIRIRTFQEENFRIAEPNIIPKEKEKGSLTMRPIANFNIDDKLILSLTNKYLTSIFDDLFLDNSTAFRQRIGNRRSPKHHDTIKEIKDYRLLNIDQPLYVAECDIKKFFDSVYHSIILQRYRELKNELYENGVIINKFAETIFYSYLHCYSFNGEVWIKNNDTNYWIRNNKNIESQFGWSDHLVSKFNRNEIGTEKIGIPQGGPLSGLIANILMHNVDKRIIALGGANVVYKRYCDDMIIIHKNAIVCQVLFNAYKQALQENLLEQHEPIPLPRRYKKVFWADGAKSKETYLWRNHPLSNAHPQSRWLSFLGYMINYNGDIKIRKKSFTKQKDKHHKELQSVISKLKDVSDLEIFKLRNSILYSFKCKLFSMAVGKVNLSNYRNEATKMCWGDGFKLIENNKYLRKQLRELDFSRGEVIGKLNLYLRRRSRSIQKTEEKNDTTDTKKFTEIGYPHSFYSLLERKLTI